MSPVPKPPKNLRDLPWDIRAQLAMRAAYERMLDEHEKFGIPVVTWRDGKVVELTVAEVREEMRRKEDQSSSPPQTE